MFVAWQIQKILQGFSIQNPRTSPENLKNFTSDLCHLTQLFRTEIVWGEKLLSCSIHPTTQSSVNLIHLVSAQDHSFLKVYAYLILCDSCISCFIKVRPYSSIKRNYSRVYRTFRSGRSTSPEIQAVLTELAVWCPTALSFWSRCKRLRPPRLSGNTTKKRLEVVALNGETGTMSSLFLPAKLSPSRNNHSVIQLKSVTIDFIASSDPHVDWTALIGFRFAHCFLCSNKCTTEVSLRHNWQIYLSLSLSLFWKAQGKVRNWNVLEFVLSVRKVYEHLRLKSVRVSSEDIGSSASGSHLNGLFDPVFPISRTLGFLKFLLQFMSKTWMN